MQKVFKRVQNKIQILVVVVQAMVIAASGLFMAFGSAPAYAAGQLSSRSLSISTASSAGSSATTQYIFSFKPASTGAGTAVNGLQFNVCTTALGTCTAPTGFSWSSATFSSQANWGDNATSFAKDATGANDCTASASVLCMKRTGATTAETSTTAHTLTLNSIQNPTAIGTFFVRITTYNLNTYTVGSILDQGTVASSTTQTLTINAAIQEVLSFCVGSSAVDDATTSVAADCSGVSGSSVNLGTLDSSTISVTPVSTTTGGSNTNAVAMLRTNAVNGATVSYKAVQQSGTNHLGTLRVSGSTCNAGSVNTDQCIDAQGGTQGTFTAGTEKFGMTVAGTNCGSTSAYSCALTSGTNNLKASTNYIGATATTFGNSAGYAWVEGGTATQIASSSTVVDDEALVLKFAATPSITTPTGAYTAQADFIVVATY